ncbi:MAG: hypothetical protein WA906_08415 [Pacificimonas sp.]
MFAGHYAAAFAARAVKPAVPLGTLFVAAQLVDFAFFGFVLIGIEDFRIVPGFLEASAYDLFYMPWTHSLVAVLVWAAAAGAAYAAFTGGRWATAAGIIVGAVVFSHWITDLTVHAPDLALWPGGPKVGFALWASLFWSQLLEVALLFAGVVLYVRNTNAKNALGKVAPWLLFVLLLAVQAASHAPADPDADKVDAAMTALIAFTLLAICAALVDRTRTAETT